MQRVEEDTQWNDVLREKGIIPQLPQKKDTPSEPESATGDPFASLTSNQLEATLDELVDTHKDESFLEEYRRKRLAEMQKLALKQKFGFLKEVTRADWKTEINEAGDLHIVIHIASQGNIYSACMDKILRCLAARFPTIKFLRGEASLCIETRAPYPESNLPTLLIYHQGELKHQLVGLKSFAACSESFEDSDQTLKDEDVLACLRKLGVLEQSEANDSHDSSDEDKVEHRHMNIRLINGDRRLRDNDSDSD